MRRQWRWLVLPVTFVVAVGALIVVFPSDRDISRIIDGLTSHGSPRIVGVEGPTIVQQAWVSCPEPGVTHVLVAHYGATSGEGVISDLDVVRLLSGR